MLKPVVFTLSDWLARLETLEGGAIALGLDRVREVAVRLEVLNFACPIVTVAGTNGKGSTVAILVWLLTGQGMHVGSYTSPHVTHFQERIQIDGNPVSDEALSVALMQVENARGEIFLTYFEWATLAALWLFKNSPIPLDVLVLEVGLGGRLDAVNIIDPSIAIVTSIGYDHQAILGESLEAIAREKAGIFREHIPAVIGKTVTQSSLLQRAAELQVPLLREGQDFDMHAGGGEWRNGERTFLIPPQSLPPSSVSLALATYTILEKQLGKLSHLQSPIVDLSHVSMVGRFFQIKHLNKIIIVDAAHNAQGAEWLATQLVDKGFLAVTAVWASLQDKALDAIAMAMKPVVKHWILGKLAVPRASSITLLKEALLENGIDIAETARCIQEGLAAALEKDSDIIVVFGSFYTVAEALTYFGLNKSPLPYHGLVSGNAWEG